MGFSPKNLAFYIDGLFLLAGIQFPIFSPFFFFFLPPAHPWQGRQQMNWNELSINFLMSWISISHLHSFRKSLAHHPKSGYVDFYMISTKGYHIHTPCWHLKGGKSKKKKDGKYFGFKMENLGIDFFAYRLFGTYSPDCFSFGKIFFFVLGLQFPSQGKIVYHRKNTSGGEKVGHYDQRGYLVGS